MTEEYTYEGEEEYYEEEEAGYGEIAVGPGTFIEGDQINCVAFDLAEESMWIGTAGGTLAQLMSPTVERFSVFPAHSDAIMDLCSIGSGVLSVSPAQLQLHTTGCAPHMLYNDPTGDLTSVHLDPSGRRALVGRAGGALTSVDLVTGKPGSTVDTGGKGVVAIRGPISRGSLVVGTADGCVSMLDARDNYRAGRTLLAHPGGLAAVAAHGDLVATCGYSGRMGQLSLEYTVKVFDVRGVPRMLAALPFAAGPTMVKFLPGFSSTLLIGAASGEFAFMDAQGGEAGTVYYAVDTGGDGLMCCDISSSAQCIAFGGLGGCVHLWANSEEPLVVSGEGVLEVPEPPPTPPSLAEDEPFSNVPSYFPADGWFLASQLDHKQIMSVGLTPRVIDPSLLQGMKQSDFVGYIQNPKVKRGGKPGEAAAAVAKQRNQRLEVRPEAQNAEEAKAERARQRAEKGGIILPGRYRRVIIKQQTGIKFEEFDFSFYNRTPFVGLENDLANCYTNALLQVLFFSPPMRDIVMSHVPDPHTEFSLMCELSFLFRLLATPGASVCQAANLLRALRQTREASVLGLLEGVKGERGSVDIEVETHKDKSLSRRLQSLSRFLLEQLNKEEILRAAQQQENHQQQRGGNQQQVQQQQQPPSSDASVTSATISSASSGGGRTKMEEIFAVFQKQRTRCLSRTARPDQEKANRVFQVDLQYPELPKDSETSKTSATNLPSGLSKTKDKDAITTGGGGGDPSSGTTNLSLPSLTDRPSFGEVLERSLHTSVDLRAWFDSDAGYQFVRQDRAPTSLPQVLVVGCGMQNKAELAWWQPVPVPDDDLNNNNNNNNSDNEEEELEEVLERDGDRNDASAHYLGRESRDISGDQSRGPTPASSLSASPTKLPPPSASSGQVTIIGADGVVVKDRRTKRQRTRPWLPFGVAVTSNIEDWEVKVEEAATVEELKSKARCDEDDDGVKAEEEEGDRRSGQHVAHALYELTGVIAHIFDEDEAALGGSDYEGHMLAHIKVPPSYAEAASKARATELSHPQLTEETSPNKSTTNTSSAPEQGGWVVFNDFHMTHCMPSEVAELYGGQKIPCLLYFTQVQVAEEAFRRPPPSPAPVLTPAGFLQLCRAPPLQKPRSFKRPRFVPLGSHEMPHPGMVLGLDAEFVAYSPPEKVVRRGIEVEARPSRLGLARVSVVRGSGNSRGVCCIDDYIRNVEPVYDYLTRYSGLVPGDLDPNHSPHHLTTLRQAYVKLRYLVDAGCVFVGHGLRKDFRMINIVVPPHQVIDTLDLFYKERSRRLSLRFIASYLLNANIQTETHDSIEDAVTAVRLYEAYKGLVAGGKFDQTLLDMYDWGHKYGWDPVNWPERPKHHEQLQQQKQPPAEQTSAQSAAVMASMKTPAAAVVSIEAGRVSVPPGLGK